MPYYRRYRRRNTLDRAARRVINSLGGPMTVGTRANSTAETQAAFGRNYRSANIVQRQNRLTQRFVGRGLYTGHGSYQSIGRNIGRTIGGAFGNRGLGSAIGHVAGSAASMFLGNGEYTSNQLVSSGESMQTPMSGVIMNDETGDFILSHREYISDVYGPSTGAFTNQSYRVNPGLETTFPWLSQIAANFEEYQFDKLLFIYRATISESTVGSGQAGTIVMATDYNAAHQPFADKQLMMEYHGAASGKVTDNHVHGVECDPGKVPSGMRYIRGNSIPAGEDPKTYDVGTFQFAIQNIPTAFFNSCIGELWVEYTVRLSKPKYYTNRGLGLQQDFYLSAEGSGALDATHYFTPSTTVLPTPPAGGAIANINYSAGFPLSAQKNNLGTVLFEDASYVYLFFPATYTGTIRFMAVMEGTFNANCAIFGAVPNTFGNVRLVSDMYAGGAITVGTDSPATVASVVVPSTATNPPVRIMQIHSIQVTASTGSVNNYLAFQKSLQTGAVPTQTYIEITERNPSFAQSSSVDAPAWQDRYGNTVVV